MPSSCQSLTDWFSTKKSASEAKVMENIAIVKKTLVGWYKACDAFWLLVLHRGHFQFFFFLSASRSCILAIYIWTQILATSGNHIRIFSSSDLFSSLKCGQWWHQHSIFSWDSAGHLALEFNCFICCLNSYRMTEKCSFERERVVLSRRLVVNMNYTQMLYFKCCFWQKDSKGDVKSWEANVMFWWFCKLTLGRLCLLQAPCIMEK